MNRHLDNQNPYTNGKIEVYEDILERLEYAADVEMVIEYIKDQLKRLKVR